jgi:F-type H+-transporting ATPase subunit b
MEVIQSILSQLGINESFFSQFIIIIVLFIILKFVLFNKLQFVLDNRDEKTVKLESSADNLFDKVNKMAEEYKNKIEEKHVEVQAYLNGEKAQSINDENIKLKEIESEIELFVEDSRSEIKEEVKEKEEEILSHTDDLAKTLIEKLTV